MAGEWNSEELDEEELVFLRFRERRSHGSSMANRVEDTIIQSVCKEHPMASGGNLLSFGLWEVQRC